MILNKKIFSVLTIICFASIILIPFGLVFMLFYTDWNKKLKIVLTSILSVLYVVLFILLIKFEPAHNSNGVVVPVNSTVGSSDFNTKVSGKKKAIEKGDELVDALSDELQTLENEQTVRIPKTLKRQQGNQPGRGFFYLLFLAFMMILIILRNLRGRKDTGYENPYVEVKLYKFPLENLTEWPTVHFQKVIRQDGENFLFACESKFNMTEGDLLITNQRFIFKGIGENVEFNLPDLEAAASVSNTCFVLTRLDKKFYFFVDESQMKYALGVLRFACGQES